MIKALYLYYDEDSFIKRVKATVQTRSPKVTILLECSFISRLRVLFELRIGFLILLLVVVDPKFREGIS